jgi:CopG family nickel-responsive transcriptional regulator
MIRIAITLPKDLIEQFDDVLKENGYTYRTKGLEDAMKEFIILHE